nr:hypothetical protein [Bacteroidales bacterium]
MKVKYIKLKEWISFHTGSDPDFSIEHRLFNVVAYLAGLIGLMTVGINFIVDSTPSLKMLSGIATIMS